MLVFDHESIGDRNFRGQRHAAYACCTGEAHANVWGFSFEPFSLNFTQMFLSVSQCAEPMTQLPKLKVKVTVQGYPFICVCSISPEPFERFALNFGQMLISVRWYDSTAQTQSQGHQGHVIYH